MTKIEQLIEFIKQNPGLRDEIDKKADGLGLKVKFDFRLEKFDGDYEPGKTPVEVIEGGDSYPTK